MFLTEELSFFCCLYHMTDKMADDAKRFMALVTGLIKRQYYSNPELTNDVLKEEVYPDLPQEDFDLMITRCTGWLKNMVSADMDMTQLEAFLTAQMKRKENALTEEQAAVFRKLWKTHKNKIHDSIVSQTIWGNTLKKVSWRVDLKSQSKNVEQINAPTAIMEFHIADNLNKNSQESEVVTFELDENKVTDMLSSMQEIKDRIQKYTAK